MSLGESDSWRKMEIKSDLNKRSASDASSGSVVKRIKTSHMGHIASADSDDEVSVRVLVPGQAVGALIGKGGETMRQLKNDSSCRLKMSKNEDLYPGTQERVFYIGGKISQCMQVLHVVIEKIEEKCSAHETGRDAFDQKGVERTQEMKIVVPNTSAGMVIGKSGARIKEIRDLTGASIQVFPKQGSAEAQRSAERVITVSGKNRTEIENATVKILEKIAADPQHAAITEALDQTNYFDFNHHSQSPFIGGPPGPMGPRPMPSGPPMGGGFDSPYGGGPRPAFSQQSPMFGGQPPMPAPMGPPPNMRSVPPPMQPQAMNIGMGPDATPPKSYMSGNGEMRMSGGSGAAIKFNPMEGIGNMEVMSFLDSLQLTLRTSGFTESAVAEIMQAMQVLAKYNIMGLGLGLGVAAMASMRGNEQSDDKDKRIEQTQQFGNSPMPRTGTYGNSGPLVKELPQMDPNQLELEVPDSMATSILAPKSKTAQDIQHFSGARIDVASNSAPGNPTVRKLYLYGQAEAVRAARVMVERAVNEEHSRRQRQMFN